MRNVTDTKSKSVLVTGGAGYIGSHVVQQLAAAGHRVIVLDNLSTGFRESVLAGKLIIGDVGDRALVTRILRENHIDSVMHFAAHTIVPESMLNPLKYYANNTTTTATLLGCCAVAGVRHFIFSSTAAVYGEPTGGEASEDTPAAPINPYGRSKLASEWILRDVAAATDLRYVVLRYFNVAGSDPRSRIGQSTLNATLLVKVACEAALGIRDAVSIFGVDYPTRDGTGVRDYIHVEDLAQAHLEALDYLTSNGPSETLNCGYGHGYSVREVIDAVERAVNHRVPTVERDRRPGDPATLIARADKIRQVLDWQPCFADIDKIVQTSLAWERKLLESRNTA